MINANQAVSALKFTGHEERLTPPNSAPRKRVHCSAWLGDVRFGLIGELGLNEVSKPRKLRDSAPTENADNAMTVRHDEQFMSKLKLICDYCGAEVRTSDLCLPASATDAKCFQAKRDLGDTPCSCASPAEAQNTQPSDESADTATDKKRENTSELELPETADRRAADHKNSQNKKR